VLAITLGFLTTPFFWASAQAADVTVFAAASLKNALDDAVKNYEAKSGDKVIVSYAASSMLAKQIEQAAPGEQRLVLDQTLLQSLPAVTIDVTFETAQGSKSGRYTGVLLWTLLEKAHPIDEPGKNASLKHTLLVTGRDGYAVALALGEIDPHYEGKQIIIAYAGGEPSASISSLRLLVPGDVHGGRSVRDVATIELR
jgi:hypothetical protein